MLCRWGWVASDPGSWALLSFDSRIPGQGHDERSEAFLGYLESFSGMGVARIECVSGCSCNSTTINGHVGRRVSLTKMRGVQVRCIADNDGLGCFKGIYNSKL